jgi:hypothetical protein
MERYSWILLAVCGSVLGLIVGLNAFLDPYHALHASPQLGRMLIQPNDRVWKLRYLSKTCERYDAYFMGDSRANTLSAADLPAVHGLRFYNLSTPADNISTILPRLQRVLDLGCPVKAVLINVSVDTMEAPQQWRPFALEWSELPAISGESAVSFYDRYLLDAQPLLTWVDRRLRPPLKSDRYYEDGHADYLWGMTDGAPFLSVQCHSPPYTEWHWARLRSQLPQFEALARLSTQYHFGVAVWIAPLNGWEAQFIREPNVARFIQQLRAIPDLTVIEPDWHAPILSDYHQWHDCGHFRTSVFDQLIAPAIDQDTFRPH